MQQRSLQNAEVILIQNVTKVYYILCQDVYHKMCQCYYKMGRLQNIMIHGLNDFTPTPVSPWIDR